jgi:hypothetical protein
MSPVPGPPAEAFEPGTAADLTVDPLASGSAEAVPYGAVRVRPSEPHGFPYMTLWAVAVPYPPAPKHL